MSNKWDVSVDFVVKECQKRKLPYLRLNTEDLINKHASISVDEQLKVILVIKGCEYDLNTTITSIWCRRPGKVYEFSNDNEKPTEAVQKFVHEQWIIWLEALSLLNNVYWMNEPNASARMENKAIQLDLARKVGFNIPRTIITNSAEKVREYFTIDQEKIVAKALYSPLIEEPDQDYFIFTTSMKLQDLVDSEVAVCPSIFQECLYPKRDFRVTVIENMVLAVEVKLDNPETSDVDWRKLESTVSYEKAILPLEIVNLCAKYVKATGLSFGAIDLVECKGTYYFLEINPSGEWGWLQKQIGLPVAESLCDVFEEHARSKV
ncbi:hypothetical protein ACMXYQ_05925 [Neptuniibacter sp. PT34_22]|uniref:hypothetical protein n=1 Tax=Neptuniibacter sp. PT34_22 TaxID=3398205 RepID=UPI0039F46729